MSDSLRVRLGFKNFTDSELRNTLLSLKKKETKNVKSLQHLIQKKFNLDQNISLLIDGYVLDATDSIDVVRDNDLILIEPKKSMIKVKTEIKTEIKSEPNIKSEKKRISSDHSFTAIPNKKEKKNEILPKSKTKTIEERNAKIVSFWNNRNNKNMSSSLTSDQTKVEFNKSIVKFENEMKTNHKKQQKSLKTSETILVKDSKPLKTDTTTVSTVNHLDVMEVKSLREIPVRKAFQVAAIKNKSNFRPQTTATTSDETKAKKKRKSKEASEPVDRFSPIIILDRQPLQTEDTSSKSHPKCITVEIGNRKQSARKSFPNPPRNKMIEKNNSYNNKKIDEIVTKKEVTKKEVTKKEVTKKEVTKKEVTKKEVTKKSIDFDNCEPLTSIPSVGDIIAFKILTLSENGNGYECSFFKMGSVLNVNCVTQMVDILLKDVIKRNNFKTMNKVEEQILGIHSLKINWSTVLEPKLVQRQSEPDFIML